MADDRFDRAARRSPSRSGSSGTAARASSSTAGRTRRSFGTSSANPRVSLHLDGNGQGGDIVVCLGAGTRARTTRPPHEIPEYVEKYAASSSGTAGHLRRSPPTTPCRCESRSLAHPRPLGPSEDEAAVRDRPPHADRLVDADRRRVLGADEEAHAGHLASSRRQRSRRPRWRVATARAPRGRPTPAGAGRRAASRRMPPP